MPGPIDAPMGAQPFASGQGSPDPLGMMNSLMEFQNRRNQNQLFQLKLGGNQAVGEIVANSPDLQSGLEAVTKNPQAMAFGSEAFANLKSAYLTGLQASGELGKQASTGLEAAIKAGMTAGMQDPSMFLPTALASLETASPAVKAQDTQALKHVAQALQAKVGGLKPQEGEAPEAFQARQREAYKAGFVGLMGMGGVSPEQINEMFPSYGITTVAGAQVPTRSYPGYMGKAPEILQGGGAGPLGPPIQSPQAGQGQGGNSPQGPPGMMPPTNPISGHPYDMGGASQIPFLQGPAGPRTDMLGNKQLPGPLQAQEKDLQDSYAKEKGEYEAAQGMNASLSQLTNAAMRLNAKGGWFATGWGGSLRSELTNLAETYKRITGKDPGDLPQANADMQDITKFSRQLAFGLENSFQGEGRHAYGLFQQSLEAVPGLNNTPLAFMALSQGIQGMIDYSIAKRTFKNTWIHSPASQGHLIGAEEDFNSQSSPIDFVRKDLGKLGITLDSNDPSKLRFESESALANAAKAGLLGPTSGPKAKQTKALFDRLHSTIGTPE